MSRQHDGPEKDLEKANGSASATDDAPVEPGEAAGLEPSASGTPADELGELRRELAELQQQLLRRRADFENYKKRVERDRAAATVEAESGLLRQLLGTVDNLENALRAEDRTAGSALREGVALTHRELMTLLETLGVQAITPLGQRFDPAEHQAILHEPAPGFEAGTVAEVYRKGYRYRDRLLRPSLVKVASEGGGPGNDASEVQ